MSATIPHWTSNAELQSGTTDSPVGCGAWFAGEAQFHPPRYRSPGVLAQCRTRVVTNTTTSGSTFTVFKNGGSTALSISVGAGLTGDFADAVNTVTVSAADTFYYFITAGGGGTITYQAVGCQFTATSNTVSRCVAQGNNNQGTAVAYYPIMGGINSTWDTTESKAQVKAPVAGTAKNLLIKIDSNSAPNAATATLRKNEADTAVTITIAAGTTGYFEDTSNTDAVALDDRLDIRVDGGGGDGNIRVRCLAIDYETTTESGIGGGSVTGAFNPATSATEFTPVAGRFENVTTESNVEVVLGLATTISRLGLRVISNDSTTTASNFRLRKNGANGNLNVVIPASTTGWFQDTASSDSLAATDTVCFAGVTSTGGGFAAMTFAYRIGEAAPGGAGVVARQVVFAGAPVVGGVIAG